MCICCSRCPSCTSETKNQVNDDPFFFFKLDFFKQNRFGQVIIVGVSVFINTSLYSFTDQQKDYLIR